MKQLYIICTAAAVSLLLYGCGTAPNTDRPAASSAYVHEVPPAQKETHVVVYLPNEEATGVTPKEIAVPAGEKNPKNAMELLLRSDRQQKYPLFPAGLTVKEVYVKDGIATVNFSKELGRLRGGSTAEEMFIAMTVSTLTEFPDVKKVQFHMEGMPIQHLSGHRDMTGTFTRDEKIIQK